MKFYDGKDVPDESLDNIKPIRYPLTKGGRIVMISTNKEYNEPVSFRPSTEDRRIMDRILTWLSSQTGMDYSNKPAAAIRKALSVTDAWLDREEE